MAGQLVGFDQGLTMSQDGKWHKDVRKVMASVLNPNAVKSLQCTDDYISPFSHWLKCS